MLKAFAIGDFQVQFGQGLTAWSSLGFGKSADVLSTARIARGIFPSRSANEGLIFRGSAVTLGYDNFRLTLFGSRRRLDANFAADSFGNLTSVLLSGLHRNEAELEDKRTVSETAAGGEVKYEGRNFTVGLSGVINQYGKDVHNSAIPNFQPGTAQKINPSIGMNYSRTWGNAYFFGEAAHAPGRGSAALQGLLISLDPRLDLAMMYRNYGRDYFSPYANAFGENTRNSNEEGIYTGLAYRFAPKWKLNAYADLFQFPWMKYRVGAPSAGHDYFAQCDYQSGKTLKVYFRFKSEVKDLNNTASNDKTYTPGPAQTRRARLQWQKILDRNLTLRSRVEMFWFSHASYPVEKGFLAFQDVEYAFPKIPLRFSARYTFFDISSFNARIYTYEDDVRYAFSLPSFQDEGAKCYLLIQYRLYRGLTAYARISRTQLYSRESIGSGLNEIPLPHRTELKFQLRYTFN